MHHHSHITSYKNTLSIKGNNERRLFFTKHFQHAINTTTRHTVVHFQTDGRKDWIGGWTLASRRLAGAPTLTIEQRKNSTLMSC